MMDSLITIIVPIYNSQNTIRRCIDSVLQQSYNSWELILVDDGSKDASFAICEEYAKLDNRIKAVSKPNGGVSSARNLGLAMSSGSYVVFIDSDDWVLPDYISHLVSAIFDYKVQFAMGYSVIMNSDKGSKECYPTNYINEANWDSAFLKNALHWHTSPWAKIYSLEIIKKNNLCFNSKMQIGEDAVFLFQYLLLVDSIYISDHTDYCYLYDSPGSLTKRVFDVDSEFVSYEQICDILDRLIISKKLTSFKVNHCINQIKAGYVRRVLNSLYCHPLSFAKRLELYKKLDISLYINYIKPDSYKEIILQSLLKSRLFCFYDIIRKIARIFK